MHFIYSMYQDKADHEQQVLALPSPTGYESISDAHAHGSPLAGRNPFVRNHLMLYDFSICMIERHSLLIHDLIYLTHVLVYSITVSVEPRPMVPEKDITIYGYGSVTWKDHVEDWRKKQNVNLQLAKKQDRVRGGGDDDDEFQNDHELPL